MEKSRIGILGGTFDPIHIGHLVTADFIMHKLELEKIIFVPAGQPPHKKSDKMASADDRYFMTVLATSDNPSFVVSDIEMEREGISYTIDTLKDLSNIYKNSELHFIVGTDAVADIPSWENASGLLNYCRFVAATRPGFSSAIEKVKEFFGQENSDRLLQIDTPELEISSTDIRERVAQGRSFKYIVPISVEQYIKKYGLYLNR